MQNIKSSIVLKIIFVVLFFAVIILTSLFLTRIQNDNASRLPYVIGSAIIPGTELPPGMVLKTFAVSPSEPVPTIAFDIQPDTMGGWDVHVSTTNFTFAPEHLDGAPVAGEGHVHLYIDNDLIIMLGNWYHIDSLTPGMHTIRVGLFNNDHSAYEVNGAQIEAQKQITVSGSASSSAMMSM